MGMIEYGLTRIAVNFDDRTLAHIEAVILTKLRRRESFLFSWDDASESGGQLRNSIWLDPAIPLRIVCTVRSDVPLNREWLAALMLAANSNAGLQIVPEPDALPEPPPRRHRSPSVARR